MTHIWVRAEQRENETRTGLTPEGARQLLAEGVKVSVEESQTRVIPNEAFAAVGCTMVPAHSWTDAPLDATIFGLKELPDDGTPLPHHHIMFGHAFKGQPAGQRLLERFQSGGGTLLDLEYLVDDDDRRVAAFGYWAGYAGAAVALMCWAAQQRQETCPPVTASTNAQEMSKMLTSELDAIGTNRPTALVIGALGRVGRGVSDLCAAMDVACKGWDINETSHGGPFPEVLEHDIFLNCILAAPGTPVFVPAEAISAQRDLRVIADIACDPDSDFSPIKVYDRTTTWQQPALRVAQSPVLDVTAIDNLPSLLPLESSEDFAQQLLPSLGTLSRNGDVWQRARETFQMHLSRL